MSAARAILLMSLVIPGLLVALSSIYSFSVDYEAMIRTERFAENLVNQQNPNDRQLEFAYHRSIVHRLNALADGTWGFIGATIAAIGIHGMATTKDETIYEQRRIK
jgi:uncharacterized protein (UPF0333 family)